MRSLRFYPALLTLGVVTCSAAFVDAQDATNAARAETLFQQGRQLMASGNYAEACPKLAASQKLDPGPGTLLNLAACYEKNGQTASAWATWIEAESASAQGGHKDWAAQAKQRAAALKPVLSHLVIVVSAAADLPGLVIEHDGIAVERAEWGTPIPVDPGSHPVRASAPQYRSWATQVSVGPKADSVSVTVPQLEKEPAAPLPSASIVPAPPATHPSAVPSAPPPRSVSAPPPDRSPWTTGRILGVAAVGVGAVALAVGSGYGLKARSTHDEALSHCHGTLCDPEGLSLDDDARKQASVATVLFATGLGLMTTGVVLYLVSGPSSAAPERSPSLSLRGSNQAATLIFQGRW